MLALSSMQPHTASHVVSQTAIMACCDLLTAYPGEMLGLLGADGLERPADCLLAQLLMKVRNSLGSLQTVRRVFDCCVTVPNSVLAQWTIGEEVSRGVAAI